MDVDATKRKEMVGVADDDLSKELSTRKNATEVKTAFYVHASDPSIA